MRKPIKNTVIITVPMEIEVEVEGYYTSGTTDTFYDRNGDPGTPGDPSEFEITQVTWHGINITSALDKDKNFDWLAMESDCLDKLEK